MALIERKQNGTALEIFLHGRIESGNAQALEQEINQSCKEVPHESLIIDAADLEYISSAGLRVMLRLAKQEASVRIINVSSDVYEIFDMTGFTEMIDIEKAYRELSVEGCEILGKGANGAVYRYSPEIVVKVYKNADALKDIQKERELARKAFVMGIPTAISYDVVKVGDTYGSVFELLDAKSFSKLLSSEPENFDRYVGMFTDVLKKVHSTEASEGIPNLKESAMRWVNVLDGHIDAAIYEKLRDMIYDIPESQHMIHGDYHTDNVVMQGDEVLLIDMDTLAHGDPILEFSQMYNGLIAFGEYDHRRITVFLGISLQMAKDVFFRTLELYFEGAGRGELDEIAKKIKIVAYTRFMRRAIEKTDITCGEGQWMYENSRKVLEELVPQVESLRLGTP